MINKKLLSFDPAAMRYVWRCVLCQWLSLLCNVAFVWALAGIVGGALGAGLAAGAWPAAFAVCMISIPLRIVCTTRASAMSDKASAGVKRTLRAKIYQKMLALGTNYSETVATSEAVMLASEGVEQIDTYFARYLPQLFYSLLAPLHPGLAVAPDWRLGLLLGLGGMAGMYLGARCQKHIPATALKYLLAGILLFTAARYLGQAL